MRTNRTIKARIMAVIALLAVFLTTTASSRTSKPECDLTGPSTMLTVCAYEVVTGK